MVVGDFYSWVEFLSALQFYGFSQMLANGYFFTGPTSNIKMSYVFLIAFVHILHVVAGIISLLVVIVQQARGKYGPEKMLGMELGRYLLAFFGYPMDLFDSVHVLCKINNDNASFPFIRAFRIDEKELNL